MSKKKNDYPIEKLLDIEGETVPPREGENIDEDKPVAKKAKASAKKSFRKVRRVTTTQDPGKAIRYVVVEDDEGNGYLMPVDTVFVRGLTKTDVSSLTPAYDWTEEIEDMLPDREKMIQQIRRSLWISGGYAKKKGRVSRRLDHAWPYRIEEKILPPKESEE